MLSSSRVSLFLLGLLLSSVSAFAPSSHTRTSMTRAAPTALAALPSERQIRAASAAFAVSILPLVVSAAEVVEDYEYGAVDAPIGLAIGGGILAIGTALLPVALRGGEEAFEEIKDQGNFGTNNQDVLNKRK